MVVSILIGTSMVVSSAESSRRSSAIAASRALASDSSMISSSLIVTLSCRLALARATPRIVARIDVTMVSP